jgi:hypothetical protein
MAKRATGFRSCSACGTRLLPRESRCPQCGQRPALHQNEPPQEVPRSDDVVTTAKEPSLTTDGGTDEGFFPSDIRPPLNDSIDCQSLGWPTAAIPSDRIAEFLQYLADEFVAGRRRGQSPDMDEYLRRVPSQEEEFRSLVALMESLASSAVDSGNEGAGLPNLDPT